MAQRNNYTEVVGAPADVGPLVLDTDLLESIRALDLPYSSGNVGDVLRTVAAIARDSRAGIKRAAGGVFDLTKSYSARAEELPEAIRILTQEDVLVLREVLALRCRTSGRDRSGLGALYAWKRVVLRRANERRNRLLPSPQPSRRRRAPRRVLYVSNNSGFGGAEQALCTLVGAIPRARYEQYALISFPGTFAAKMARAGVHVKCANRGFFSATVENCLSVRKAIAGFAPEIVHFNGVAGLPALLAAKTLAVPVIQHVRVFGLAGYEDQLDWAERVVAVSEFVAGHLRRRNVQPDKIKVVWDGVDAAEFAPRACDREQSRHNLRIPPGTSLVTVVARHSRSKRQDLAVRAAALAAKRVKELRLLLVGDSYGETGAYEETKAIVKSLGMTERCIWLGFQEDIRPVLAATDVLLLCSEREALGLSVIEAMAMGVPVVVTDEGGMPESVQHEVNGLVVPAGDVAAIAGALVQVLGDSRLATELGTEGRRRVESCFTAQQCAERMMSVFDSV